MLFDLGQSNNQNPLFLRDLMDWLTMDTLIGKEFDWLYSSASHPKALHRPHSIRDFWWNMSISHRSSVYEWNESMWLTTSIHFWCDVDGNRVEELAWIMCLFICFNYYCFSYISDLLFNYKFFNLWAYFDIYYIYCFRFL